MRGRDPVDGVDKDDRIAVRCSENTAIDFKRFAAYYSTQAAALRDLLRVARENPGLTSKYVQETSLPGENDRKG